KNALVVKMEFSSWPILRTTLYIEKKSIRKSEIRNQSYVPTISNKLKSILNSVGLTISDFEKLLDIKGGKSNIMFHESENQSLEEARKQLDETAFPDDIAYIKNTL